MALHPLHPAPTRSALPPVFGRGPRALRRSWVVATMLGESAGFLIPAGVALVVFDLHPTATLVLMVLAGSLEGLVLGRAQASVLRRELLSFPVWSWATATGAGAALAWFVGMLPSTFYPWWSDWPLVVLVPLALLLGAVLLLSVGGAQWFVLRHHVPRSRTWAPVNAVAWALGLGVMLAVATPLWHEGQSPAAVVAVGALAGLLMAATVALVTGWWLARLTVPHDPSATPPPGVAPETWHRLAGSTDEFRVFDPGLVIGLPEPVQRWLLHAVTPGSTLLTGCDALSDGQIRLGGTWRHVVTRQRSTLRDGFVWSGRTRMLGLPVTGFDRFERGPAAGDDTRDAGAAGGSAELRWRVARRVRVVAETGPEVARSAAGRHAAEMLALAPAVALDPAVRWEEIDARRAVAHVVVGGETQSVTVSIDRLGQLRRLEMDRWGAPPGPGPVAYGRHRFGAVLGEERMFDGYLVPTDVVVGWHAGTVGWDEGVFLRYRVLRCSFH